MALHVKIKHRRHHKDNGSIFWAREGLLKKANKCIGSSSNTAVIIKDLLDKDKHIIV